MSNQCKDCESLECQTALIDSEGYVVASIIANYDDDFTPLKDVYEFETTVECCDNLRVGAGDKYNAETNTFTHQHYFPGIHKNDEGKFVLDKSTPWINHPDYVEREPEPELTEAEQKLAALGLTKEDLQSLLA